MARHQNLPARNDRPIVGVIVGGNANRHHALLIGVKETELVEMVVQPTHCVLDRHMEVPEGLSADHAEPPTFAAQVSWPSPPSPFRVCVSPRHENPFVREFEQPQ